MLTHVIPKVFLELAALGYFVFGAAMSHKEAIVCMLVQIINCSNNECQVVTSTFDYLGVEHMRNESKEMVIVATCA
jgi:hypothetical protein